MAKSLKPTVVEAPSVKREAAPPTEEAVQAPAEQAPEATEAEKTAPESEKPTPPETTESEQPEESDQEARLQEKMQERIDAAMAEIAADKIKLDGRDLSKLLPKSIEHANKLEDQRDALKANHEAGALTDLEFTRQLTPVMEALAKTIAAWERTTSNQDASKDQGE